MGIQEAGGSSTAGRRNSIHQPMAISPSFELFLGREPLPDSVSILDGLGDPEEWGRWNRGAHIHLRLRDPLPREFDLVLEAAVTGGNVGRPFAVSAGDCERVIVFGRTLEEGLERSTTRMRLTTVSRSVEIRLPGVDVGVNGDRRGLGLALAYLKIVSATPASQPEEMAAVRAD